MEKFVSLVSFVAHSRETKQGDAKDAVCVLRLAQHDRGLGDGRLVKPLFQRSPSDLPWNAPGAICLSLLQSYIHTSWLSMCRDCFVPRNDAVVGGSRWISPNL